MALLDQNFGEILFGQNPFPAILRRKGVKALVVGPLKNNFFLRLPLLWPNYLGMFKLGAHLCTL